MKSTSRSREKSNQRSCSTAQYWTIFGVFYPKIGYIQLSNNFNHSIMTRTHPIFNFKKSEIKKKQQKTEHLISANGKMDHSVRRESQDGPTFSQTIKSPGQVVWFSIHVQFKGRFSSLNPLLIVTTENECHPSMLRGQSDRIPWRRQPMKLIIGSHDLHDCPELQNSYFFRFAKAFSLRWMVSFVDIRIK
jgi:hypothetical protein